MESDFFYSEREMGSLSDSEKVKAQLMRFFIRNVTVHLLDKSSNAGNEGDSVYAVADGITSREVIIRCKFRFLPRPTLKFR